MTLMLSEVKTLNTARASATRMVQCGFAFALSLAVSAPVFAQARPAQVPRMMITNFQGSDRELGQQTAEAMRNRVQRDAGTRGLAVISRDDINNTLQASGYSVTEALAPSDARALAQLLRADEYVDGVVVRTPAGVRIDARLILARDNTVTQTLPPAEGARVDAAVAQVSRDLLEARRQVDAERACSGALRVNDVPRAIRDAERGLQQHTRFNNMIRVCLAQAYVRRDTPADSTDVVSPQTLQLAEQVLESDPRNVPALRIAAIGYRATDNEDRYIQTLTALVAADPADLRLQEQVVNELAASGRASLAVPIIMDALRNNPGDARMLRTGWLVLLAAQDFEQAIRVGEEMVRVDTAQATADFYRRLALAHVSLSQHQLRTARTAADTQAALGRRQEGLAVSERAVQRFPGDAALLTVYAQALLQAGQPQRAVDIARRALAASPDDNDARVQLVQAYVQSGMLENAASAIREAAAAGANRLLLSQLALQVGQERYRAGQASRSRADFEASTRFLRLSNEMQASVDAQFLLGAASFSLGDALTRQAQEQRDCAAARAAQDAFSTARPNLIAGQSQYPEPARQLLDAIGQFTAPLAQMVRAYCR
jgi:tetratricopeptide (TPR) repeat protein